MSAGEETGNCKETILLVPNALQRRAIFFHGPKEMHDTNGEAIFITLPVCSWDKALGWWLRGEGEIPFPELAGRRSKILAPRCNYFAAIRI